VAKIRFTHRQTIFVQRRFNGPKVLKKKAFESRVNSFLEKGEKTH
jgi:hypothetical protein